MEIRVNEESFPHNSKPGSFVSISRTWKTGDRIEVKLPMSLRLEPMPDNATRTAICYGPVVLAGELGTEGIKPPMPYGNFLEHIYLGAVALGQQAEDIFFAGGQRLVHAARAEWLSESGPFRVHLYLYRNIWVKRL